MTLLSQPAGKEGARGEPVGDRKGRELASPCAQCALWTVTWPSREGVLAQCRGEARGNRGLDGSLVCGCVYVKWPE